jgi:hypothetical protein
MLEERLAKSGPRERLRPKGPITQEAAGQHLHLRDAPACDTFLLARNDMERREYSMEQRFGPLADAALTREGIVTDDDSRRKLIEALARDLTEAAKKLARNADGNYSPDTYADRFPQLNEVKAVPQTGRTLSALADAWHTHSLSRGMRLRDAKRWKAVALRFKEWLGHDDLSRVTAERVQA